MPAPAHGIEEDQVQPAHWLYGVVWMMIEPVGASLQGEKEILKENGMKDGLSPAHPAIRLVLIPYLIILE